MSNVVTVSVAGVIRRAVCDARVRGVRLPLVRLSWAMMEALEAEAGRQAHILEVTEGPPLKLLTAIDGVACEIDSDMVGLSAEVVEADLVRLSR